MKALTLEEIIVRIKNRFPLEQFEIIEFNGMGEPGSIKCLNCGKIITLSKFSNFFAPSKSVGCSACQSNKQLQYQHKIATIKEKYDIINVTVQETHKYYTVKCKKCGHVRNTSLNNLYKHQDCGCITNVYRNRTEEEFLNTVNNNSLNDTYKCISAYINQTTPVLLQHSCGFIWKARPSDIIIGHSSCPKCSRKRSKGEMIIANFLRQQNIPFEEEKQLKNSKQRFDFYLENKNYKIAIEYNGKQHYEETNFFHDSLEVFQQRDEKKRIYCLENNIALYIIPYTYSEKEIQEKLLFIINKFNDQSEDVGSNESKSALSQQ